MTQKRVIVNCALGGIAGFAIGKFMAALAPPWVTVASMAFSIITIIWVVRSIRQMRRQQRHLDHLLERLREGRWEP
jgi:hypothetical protein